MPASTSCNRHGISSPGRRDRGDSNPSASSIRLPGDDRIVPGLRLESKDERTGQPAILQRTTSPQSQLVPRRFRWRPTRGCGPGHERYSQGLDQRLAVHPDYRRRSIARRLVRACERVLRQQGLKMFAALIEPENRASEAFFRSLGYEILPILYARKKLRESV